MATQASSKGEKLAKRYVTSVSFDMGLMEVNEEKLKVTAANFFRGRFHKKGADAALKEEAEKQVVKEDGRPDNFEPDWSAFESAFAAGEWIYDFLKIFMSITTCCL